MEMFNLIFFYIVQKIGNFIEDLYKKIDLFLI